MNITPEEFIEIQYQAAKRAVASVTEVKPLAPLDCGVEYVSWIDAIECSWHGRLSINIAGHQSELSLKCDRDAARSSKEKEYNRIYLEMRAHIEKEVERIFGKFLAETARKFVQLHNTKAKP